MKLHLGKDRLKYDVTYTNKLYSKTESPNRKKSCGYQKEEEQEEETGTN